MYRRIPEKMPQTVISQLMFSISRGIYKQAKEERSLAREGEFSLKLNIFSV